MNHLEFPFWFEGAELVVNIWEDEAHTLGLRLLGEWAMNCEACGHRTTLHFHNGRCIECSKTGGECECIRWVFR